MILFLLIWSWLQAMPPTRGSIDGVVTTAGTALERLLPNARLELKEGPGTPIVVRSDGGGRFVFSNLAPGLYRLFLTEDGYIRQEYGQRSPNTSGIPISVSAGQAVKNVTFRLESAPTIMGWVQDEFGYPVPGILVQAFRQTFDVRGKSVLKLFASALSDDRGQYRIFWVDPGEYFASAASPPAPANQTPPTAAQTAFAPVYFPGVTDPEAAKSFRVEIGREVRADFRMRRQALATVNGTLTHALTGHPVAGTITLAPVEEANVARYETAGNGQFLIQAVLPGSYLVSAHAASGEKLAAFARIRILSAPRFSLTVRLTLNPALGINGRFFSSSERIPDLRGSMVTLTSLEEGFPSPQKIPASPDGQFILSGVFPGEYLLGVAGLPDDTYVRAARYGATDALEAGLRVSLESPPLLQILLDPAGGRLSTSVIDRQNRPAPGARIVLVPDMARRHRPDQYKAVVADDAGHASIRGIAPGSYKIFAWESIEPNAHFNTDYLRGYEDLGIAVRITAGDNASVNLRLIPAY